MKSTQIVTDKAQQKRIIEDAPLGIYFPDDTKLFNPLRELPDFIDQTPELFYTWVMSRPEYFWLTCKILLNVDIHVMQGVILQNLWKYKFPMLVGSRGMGKSFLLAVYALLRIVLLRNRKVIICGSGFRQSKIIFGYMETIRSNSPILRNIIPESSIFHATDGYKMVCGDSFAMAIPIGTGDKIRGLRANDVIADEFASVPVEIFETVIAGFAAVASSPTEQAAAMSRQAAANYFGFEFADDRDAHIGNQIIVSGTAYYSFNHFAAYHEKYKKFIKLRGDHKKIVELIGEDWANFNPDDFCIIRIAVDMLPPGFMDAAQVARAKATVNNGIYQMEYGAVFSSDSNGFYKRTLIEGCVVKMGQDIIRPNGEILSFRDAMFEVMTSGNKEKMYVMGIDPAMAADNFSIVILELNQECRKIVYCWTTNKDDHRNKLTLNLTKENNYYAYCARKIRSLMARFNIVNIAIDAEGGGRSVMESLNDINLIRPGEVPLWPIINFEKPEDTDGMSGSHIIDVIRFAREDWTSQANHGLRKDFEDKVVLFPFFDAISFLDADLKVVLSDNEDSIDKLIEEIEELKNELSTISVSTTPMTNRERWDTPEIKLPNSKKGRQRKDRYSALLMANMTARTQERAIHYDIHMAIGGFSGGYMNKDDDKDPRAYIGHAKICATLNALYND